MTVFMTPRLEDPVPTRSSLLTRLKNWDDQEGWKVFFDTYWRLIYSVALKSGLTDAEAQDVVQETVISVAKHIHKFERNRSLGSFKGWLRNIIRWRIADQVEKRSLSAKNIVPLYSDDGEAPDIAEIPDPGGVLQEDMWEEEWRTNLFQTAVQRVKRRVKEEHYFVFDLHVVRQWPVLKVAQKLGVSVGQIYLIKHRISTLVRKEIRALEQKPV